MSEEKKKRSKPLTKKEIAILKDYFRMECDKHKFSPRKNMHRFRMKVERQEFTYIEEAEKQVDNIIRELGTERRKEEEEKKQRRRKSKPEKPEPELPKKDLDNAIAFLKDPSLLYKIHRILGKDIAGEEKNRLLLFVLGSSVKTKYKQMVVLKGESAVGKNWLADHVIVTYFPTRKRGRFTEHAMEYADINPKEILYLQQLFTPETGGTLRLISTSDKGFIFETTIRDEDIGLCTETIAIPAVTMITTTTFIYLDKEFTTRIWILSLDESEIQTKRILESLDKREEVKLKQLSDGIEEDPEKIILRNAMSILPPINEVIIPFNLAEYFPVEFLRVRRDFEKFQDLVKLLAYLHFLNRPTLKIKGKKVIFATPQDVYYALALGEETISMTLSGTEKRIKEIVKVVQALSAGKATGASTGEEKLIGEVTVNDVMVATGRARTPCYYALKQLSEEGRLTIRKKGRTYLYRPTDKLSLLSFSVKDSLKYRDLAETAVNRLKTNYLFHTEGYKGLYYLVVNPFTGKSENLENREEKSEE